MRAVLDELADAEARLTDAERTVGGPTELDLLDLDAARMDVESARRHCAAEFAELFGHASRTDGVREFVGRLVENLGIVDQPARDLIHGLTGQLREAWAELAHLRHQLESVSRAVAALETEVRDGPPGDG